MATFQFTGLVLREQGGYSALCVELDLASQGDTPEQALANLREATESFLQCADPNELEYTLHNEVYVTHFEVDYE